MRDVGVDLLVGANSSDPIHYSEGLESVPHRPYFDGVYCTQYGVANRGTNASDGGSMTVVTAWHDGTTIVFNMDAQGNRTVVGASRNEVSVKLPVVIPGTVVLKAEGPAG